MKPGLMGTSNDASVGDAKVATTHTPWPLT